MNTWLIVDIEATCWKDGIMPNGERQSFDNMEIIKISCAVATEKVDLLHSQSIPVRPTEFPILSPFCTSLNSITQDLVDRAFTLDHAIKRLNHYVLEFDDLLGWCSWGDYELNMFEAQTKRLGYYLDILSFPHLNIKDLWFASTAAGFTGHYREVDDEHNLARLMPFMNWGLKDQFLTAGHIVDVHQY